MRIALFDPRILLLPLFVLILALETQATDRIFCRDGAATFEPSLVSLRTDSVATYSPSGFTLTDENQSNFKYLFDFIPVASDASNGIAKLVALAEKKNGVVGLFLIEFDFSNRQQKSILLSAATKPSANLVEKFRELGLPRRSLGGHSQILFPTKEGYSSFNLATGEIRPQIKSSQALNPRWDNHGRQVRVDQLHANGLIQSVRSESQDREAITDRPELGNYQVLFTDGTTQLAVELLSQNNNIENNKNLKKIWLFQANQAKNLATWDDEHSLPILADWRPEAHDFTLQSTTQHWVLLKDPDGMSLGYQLNSGAAFLQSWNYQGQELSLKSASFSEAVLQKGTKLIGSSGNFMLQMLFEDSSQVGSFSLGSLGQMAKIDWQTKEWALLGRNVYRCNDPRSVHEVN